ncbi:MAG: TA system VapC family ribonuclease toxin [Pyrinomonadaceae bacterium]
MIVLDANILIYAYIDELPQHADAAAWLEGLLRKQTESVGLAWIVVNALLRLSTSRSVFKHPWKVTEATTRIDELLEHPMVQLVPPGENHWAIYSRLLRELKISGNVVMDAHLAAIAIHHDAAVASADKDFNRFSEYLKILDPLKN